MSTLNEDHYTFFIISCSFLLRMRNVSDRRCRENQNTHFVFINIFFFKKHAVYKHVNNIPEWGRPQGNMAHVHCMLDSKVYKYKHYTQVV